MWGAEEKEEEEEEGSSFVFWEGGGMETSDKEGTWYHILSGYQDRGWRAGHLGI